VVHSRVNITIGYWYTSIGDNLLQLL
jgi:hypothetical protein